jgi:hypothetical protein
MQIFCFASCFTGMELQEGNGCRRKKPTGEHFGVGPFAPAIENIELTNKATHGKESNNFLPPGRRSFP